MQMRRTRMCYLQQFLNQIANYASQRKAEVLNLA